jgi:hypothetical protein
MKTIQSVLLNSDSDDEKPEQHDGYCHYNESGSKCFALDLLGHTLNIIQGL